MPLDIIYPPPSFYFQLSFPGKSSSTDASFQELSGISAELSVEEITEGGENKFKYKLPGTEKFGNLVLRRGVAPATSNLITWCNQTIESDFSSPIQVNTITVALLNAEFTTLMSWDFFNAYPVKWSISDFKAQENQLAIESIEFAYNYFTRTV